MPRLVLPLLLAAACGLCAQATRDWNTPHRPYKVIGNIYYVGPTGLSAHLITTPEGNILIDSGFETTVPLIRESIAKLGFNFRDTRILLSSHAHPDHTAGHFLVKELTGARVMATKQDAEVIEAGGSGKACKVDRIIAGGDKVTLGGVTLTAHLTPGHTKGCTTWTMQAQEEGKTYDVVFVGGIGINQGVRLVGNARYPNIAEDYAVTFRVLKALSCDIFLAQHAAIYNMVEKAKKLESAPRPNPFIDPEGYKKAIGAAEQAYLKQLAEERVK